MSPTDRCSAPRPSTARGVADEDVRMDPAQSAADAAWITAWATVGLVALALATAIVAALVGSRQIREAREARRQARDLADEVAQPYVVAFMEPASIDPGMIDFVVKNFGRTGAEHVRIVVSPPMQSAELEESGRGHVVLPASVPFLAPGQEWRVFWDSGQEREGSGLPDSHTAIVSYRDSRGKQHSTSAVLDFAAHDGRIWASVKSIHHVATSLGKLEETVRSFQEGAGRGAKVWVRSGDDKDERAAERRQSLEARASAKRDDVPNTTLAVDGGRALD